MKTASLNQRADYVGITGSVLCTIYCLITPIVVLTSTLLSHDALRMGFLSIDYLFIGINIAAVWSASRYTCRRIRIALQPYPYPSHRNMASTIIMPTLP